MERLFKIIVTFVLLFPAIVYSQRNEKDTIYTYYTEEKIKIDGIFNEVAWNLAKPITSFIQREPNEGQPISEPTKVVMLYNKHTLYIGLWAYDSQPKKIIAKDMARDGRWGSSDNFEIVVSTFNDNRNAYLFVVNPNGARGDAIITDEGNGFNEDWNAVWDVAVHRSDSGWFAEIEIPFSTLKFPDKANQIWGINIERNIRYKKEQASWQGWSRNYSVFKISQAGRLAGLNNISSNLSTEIKPFLSAGIQGEQAKVTDKKYKIGGDVNYIFSPSTKMNVTVNTDFSQVESDRTPINLSRFSVLMPEKREFFLEGKDQLELNLGTDLKTFYSRNIGIRNGEEIPIYGGVKLIGKEKNTNFGILSILTPDNNKSIENYSVIRIKQDISRQSSVGIITTAVNTKDHFNYVYGADINLATAKMFGNNYLAFGGAFTQSQTTGAINKDNLAYNLFLNYPNDLINYVAAMGTIQKSYNPELGFSYRKNYDMYNTSLELKPRSRFISWIKQYSFKPFDIKYYYSSDTKDLESVNLALRPLGFKTVSGELLYFNVYMSFDKPTNDFSIFDTIKILKGAYWFNSFDIDYESYPGRTFVYTAYMNYGEYYNGTRNNIYFTLAWYPSKHFNITGDWRRNYVYLPQGNFMTDEFGARVEYAFTPKLINSVFGQWNNSQREILLNYRIGWIPKIGSDFYFVINQSISTQDDKLVFKQFTVLFKYIFRFVV